MTRNELLLIAEGCGYTGDEAKAYAAGYEAALQSRQAAVSGSLPDRNVKADLRQIYKRYDGAHHYKFLDAVEEYIKSVGNDR